MIRPGVESLFEFVWLPTFERTAEGILDDDDRRAIEERLCNDPRTGRVMERTGGFRKLRHAVGGRGRSGGARVIYLFGERCERFYMMLVYAKARKATLTSAERRELRHTARLLRQEEC